eukprot:468263-Rhodomonas_salina.2
MLSDIAIDLMPLQFTFESSALVSLDRILVAEKAISNGELQIGDTLHSINGQQLKESTTMYDVASLLLGPAGTSVTITIAREDEKKQVKLERRHLDIDSARHFREQAALPGGVAVVI